MREQLELLPRLLGAHLALSLSSLLIGICISLPLGVLASRRVWLGRVITSASAVLQTIPSLALLALMVPLLGFLGLPSIGFLPAFVALVLYTLLPVLRNTVTGLTNLPADVLEAARGVGMDGWQQLWRVELPLALPVIVAGIRTASVWTVGAATLATPVGADSLGNFIFSGLQTRNWSAVLVGCLGAAALALALDGLGQALVAGLERRRRWLALLALSCFAGLYSYAAAVSFRQGDERVMVVGAKTFTEQYILSELIANRITSSTGLAATIKPSLGSSIAFDALVNGSVDVYVDYSGTLWTTVLRRSEPASSRHALLAEVERYLRDTHGVTLAARLGFENTYALAMRQDRAERLGIRRISDLAAVAGDFAVGGDYEFFARPEWRAILEIYQLRFAREVAMDPSLMYQAVSQGNVDVIGAFSTDGRIAADRLVTLADDRGAIPPYDAIVLVGRRAATRHPEVISSLQGLEGSLDAERMRSLNLEVDVEGHPPAEVAKRFAQVTPPR